MPNVINLPSFISTKIENGITFDALLDRLLAYKVETWGWIIQDYTQISSMYNSDTNDLFYLPSGNYVITNYPESTYPVQGYENVNTYIFEKKGVKYILADFGNEKYLTSITSAGETPDWIDYTTLDSNGNPIKEIHVDDSAPSDTSILWIDTSKINDNEVVLKYYNGSTWVSYTESGLMYKSVYDTDNESRDIYDLTDSTLSLLITEYENFIKHKNNELPLIHITSDDRESYNKLISPDQLNEKFASDGQLHEDMIDYVTSEIGRISGTSNLSPKVEALEDKFDSYIYGNFLNGGKSVIDVGLSNLVLDDATNPIDNSMNQLTTDSIGILYTLSGLCQLIYSTDSGTTWKYISLTDSLYEKLNISDRSSLTLSHSYIYTFNNTLFSLILASIRDNTSYHNFMIPLSFDINSDTYSLGDTYSFSDTASSEIIIESMHHTRTNLGIEYCILFSETRAYYYILEL